MLVAFETMILRVICPLKLSKKRIGSFPPSLIAIKVESFHFSNPEISDNSEGSLKSV
jgi:hypothetical protein